MVARMEPKYWCSYPLLKSQTIKQVPNTLFEFGDKTVLPTAMPNHLPWYRKYEKKFTNGPENEATFPRELGVKKPAHLLRPSREEGKFLNFILDSGLPVDISSPKSQGTFKIT